MNNIYNNPEKFGLSIVRAIDDAGSYEFDILLILENEAGELFWITDSGCSCPTPFDGCGIEDLSPLTVDTYAAFQEMLVKRERRDWNALNSADRVDIERIVARKLTPKLAKLMSERTVLDPEPTTLDEIKITVDASPTYWIIAGDKVIGRMTDREAAMCADFLRESCNVPALVDFFDWMAKRDA